MGGFQTALAVLGAIQNQHRYAADNAALAARQRADAGRLNLARRIDERQKHDRLARLQATQRATFGAAGIGRGGSADAVINGLAEATDRSIRGRRSLDRLRLGRAADNAAAGRKANLLSYQRRQARRLPITNPRLSLLEG